MACDFICPFQQYFSYIRAANPHKLLMLFMDFSMRNCASKLRFFSVCLTYFKTH